MTTTSNTPSGWESQLSVLLNDLLSVQSRFLGLLERKRQLLAAEDLDGLQLLSSEEEELSAELQACVARRAELLRMVRDEGIAADNLRSLAERLAPAERTAVEPQLRRAAAQARLLRHESMVHWVVVQRTLLHLTQLLEIIATGGKLQPTYGRGEPVACTGGLVDRAA